MQLLCEVLRGFIHGLVTFTDDSKGRLCSSHLIEKSWWQSPQDVQMRSQAGVICNEVSTTIRTSIDLCQK